MPRQKDLKRIIRGRMQKTGESYATARSQTLRRNQPTVAAAESVPDYDALAPVRDTAIADRTGRGWAQWVAELDRHGAQAMSHKDIAALVSQQFGVDGWWSQAVTVGYERIKGLRSLGQRRDGSFEASKSRTYNVPVEVLFEACADDDTRGRWLHDVPTTVRTGTAPRTLRLQWPDGTIVAVWFTDKGRTKSHLALAHQKLPDRAAQDLAKQEWGERLEALGRLLDG
jgi:uncharacterized protein YndB with AHSA1/START domain